MSEIHNEVMLLKQTIGYKSDLIIFDIGGCNFHDSIYLKLNFPNAQIYSFEPNKENLKLYKNEADSFGIIVVPVAVGDKNDVVTFYNSPTHNGSGSVLKPKTKKNTSEAINHDGLFFNMDGYDVQIVRLDTICELNNIDKIDYLHIDVQGNEHSVIKGLGKYRPYFIFAETCEFDTYDSKTSLKEFEEDLEKMGYEIMCRFRDDTLYKLKGEFDNIQIPKWLPKI